MCHKLASNMQLSSFILGQVSGVLDDSFYTYMEAYINARHT